MDIEIKHANWLKKMQEEQNKESLEVLTNLILSKDVSISPDSAYGGVRALCIDKENAITIDSIEKLKEYRYEASGYRIKHLAEHINNKQVLMLCKTESGIVHMLTEEEFKAAIDVKDITKELPYSEDTYTAISDFVEYLIKEKLLGNLETELLFSIASSKEDDFVYNDKFGSYFTKYGYDTSDDNDAYLNDDDFEGYTYDDDDDDDVVIYTVPYINKDNIQDFIENEDYSATFELKVHTDQTEAEVVANATEELVKCFKEVDEACLEKIINEYNAAFIGNYLD